MGKLFADVIGATTVITTESEVKEKTSYVEVSIGDVYVGKLWLTPEYSEFNSKTKRYDHGVIKNEAFLNSIMADRDNKLLEDLMKIATFKAHITGAKSPVQKVNLRDLVK